MNRDYHKHLITNQLWPILKRIIIHIEWPIIIGIWGFFTVIVVINDKEYPLIFIIFITILGIICTALAAYNSYRHKSTALLDKYEEIFCGRMESKRKSAAQFLLGNNQDGSYDLEDVLNFFEAPLARKVNSGEIDPFEAYSYFYHWLKLYWQAAQKYIEDYRKYEPAAWVSLKALYEELSNYEKAEIKRDSGKQCSNNDLVFKSDKLRIYLRQEAR